MGFFNKDRKPRIAYREQRNGVKQYFIEVWGDDGAGSRFMQDSKLTESLEEAEKMLKEISDKEIVEGGIIK